MESKLPEELVLYVDSQFASPFAMSAYVALMEKGLHFELRALDLAAREHHAPGYADRSLTRRVPMLVHEGFALSESSAIAEYVDEVFGGTPLYPRTVQQRATARQLQAWLRSDLMPIRQQRTTEVLFYGPVATPLDDAGVACADSLFAAAQSLISAEADFLFGEWSLADLDLALMLNRLVLNGDAVPQRLAAYARKQWQRPSVQAWLRKDRPPL